MASGAYTCISCRVVFKDADIQRQHYKTDWHRYNLKRKIAELPPVTAEDFQSRVLQQRAKIEAESQEVSLYCDPCHKTFSTQNAYDNHLQSKRHKELEVEWHLAFPNKGQVREVQTNTRTEEIEEVDSDEWEAEGEEIHYTNCLFCNHHSASLAKNLKHMSATHSFFIPDIEFVVDMSGLMSYLGSKIGQGFMCLWCDNGKSFWSLDATQQHMRDKGHCKIKHDGATLAEYVQFYDYSSSYPEQEGEPEDDMEVDIPELDDSDYTLTLPSGVTIGHRILMRYYKQNLNPNMSLKPRQSGAKYVAQYKAIGYSSSTMEAISRKSKDITFMKRIQAKIHLKLGVKGNKLQHHFRQQVNF